MMDKHVYRDVAVKDIDESCIGRTVKAAGWVENIRDHGGVCFLDLRDVKSPLLLNRKYDGKLAAGDEVVVQVYKEAVKTKPPSVTCALSLDGKYCVVTKGRAGIAYSAKLSAKTEEKIGMGLKESPFP